MTKNPKKQSDHTSNDKTKCFFKMIMVIEYECFDDINLTDVETFSTALNKHS